MAKPRVASRLNRAERSGIEVFPEVERRDGQARIGQARIARTGLAGSTPVSFEG